MLPTLLGQPQTNRHDFLYWEFHERGFQQAVRMGDWKAVRPQAGAPLELYNLKHRPRRETECGRAESRGRGEDRSVSENRPDRIGAMADQSRQAAAGEEAAREVVLRSVRGVGAFKSWMRRARSISLLIHRMASAIANKTAARTNHGHV